MSTGVMIAGLRGATGSTLVATAGCASKSDIARCLLSSQRFAEHMNLPAPGELRWGGWDVLDQAGDGRDSSIAASASAESYARWKKTLRRHGVLDPDRFPELLHTLTCVDEFPAIALTRDHAVAAGEALPASMDGAEIAARLRRDIGQFRARTSVDQVILLYLATPAMLPPECDWPQNASELRTMINRGAFASAAPYYIAAAIEEGAAVIDYTASATLEMPGLVDLAEKRGVPLAGRDGSTGQTLLKSVLAETFATRGLGIAGWYSTNILGNHDGFVLQDHRYCDVKRLDKTALLDHIVGYEVPEHVVDIRYYGPAGDNKEAWDAIDFTGWFGCSGQLRLNWRCSDSLLATPALIDLIRFTSHALATGRAGIQSHLGVFFKYPLGTSERRYLRLADRLKAYCARDRARVHAPAETAA